MFVGVIMFVLLGGYPPFDDENQKKMFRKIKKAQYDFHEQYWSSVTEEAKDLIRGMLEIDATKRLTVDQVLSHPWVRISPQQHTRRSNHGPRAGPRSTEVKVQTWPGRHIRREREEDEARRLCL